MSTLKTINIQHPSSTIPNMVLDQYGAVSGGLPSPNRNLFYNGAMQIAQRGTSATGVLSSGYKTADRWLTDINGGLGIWTQSVEADGPNGTGFTKSLKMLCTTTSGTPGSTDMLNIAQRIEGQDVQRIAKGTASAQQLTLSFWVKSNVTGTYTLLLFDATNTRSISATYSISASATWEKKMITFAADTTGQIVNSSSEGLALYWCLGAGSTLTSGTMNTSWGAYTSSRAVGQVNVAATANNYWQITGVQLEVGSIPTPFEFKTYGQELSACQRYYYSSYTTGVYANSADTISGHHQAIGVDSTSAVMQNGTLPVPMRATPTFNIYHPGGGQGAGSMRDHYTGGTVITGVSISGANNRGLGYVAKNGGIVLGHFYGMEITADAEL